MTQKQKQEIEKAIIKQAKNKYTICVYSDLYVDFLKAGIDIMNKDESGSHLPDYTFYAKNKRQVVGLIITIMDNLKPNHIDIISDKAWLLDKVG